ncbi:hypothetical protein FHR83_003225 [Actinoplanes campanulatus]|uniref:Lipoprotein n=1 Tax=Actinoplanes campanulatus TaxID=113559 RepID=A0A7W5AGC5_9ACTN|nr:hypothetical protein [Actinoplanes campanulatus]MBB3095555.1 hypothetical protein [Actinoplanes campanulatus]
MRRVCVAALLALAMAGCDKAEPAPTATAVTTVAASEPAATTAATTTATTAPVVLEDGRHPVYLTKVAAGTVTFDLIEFLTGDKAKALWKKEHPENPDGPPNDYIIVNENPKLRTLPVAADADCEALETLGGVDMTTVPCKDLAAFLKKQNEGLDVTPPHIAVLPFWLTVEDGTVVRFEEQFLP